MPKTLGVNRDNAYQIAVVDLAPHADDAPQQRADMGIERIPGASGVAASVGSTGKWHAT
jgi:hypothetical protein